MGHGDAVGLAGMEERATGPMKNVRQGHCHTRSTLDGSLRPTVSSSAASVDTFFAPLTEEPAYVPVSEPERSPGFGECKYGGAGFSPTHTPGGAQRRHSLGKHA